MFLGVAEERGDMFSVPGQQPSLQTGSLRLAEAHWARERLIMLTVWLTEWLGVMCRQLVLAD